MDIELSRLIVEISSVFDNTVVRVWSRKIDVFSLRGKNRMEERRRRATWRRVKGETSKKRRRNSFILKRIDS